MTFGTGVSHNIAFNEKPQTFGTNSCLELKLELHLVHDAILVLCPTTFKVNFLRGHNGAFTRHEHRDHVQFGADHASVFEADRDDRGFFGLYRIWLRLAL